MTDEQDQTLKVVPDSKLTSAETPATRPLDVTAVLPSSAPALGLQHSASTPTDRTVVQPPVDLDATIPTVPGPSGSPGVTLMPPGERQPTGPTSRYRVVRLHAKGGLGQVSVALDLELGREVALKEIQGPYADDEEARARFIREAEITGRLEHPGIVPVYGLGAGAGGSPYYAMQFIRGRSLKEALDEFHEQPATGQTTAPARRHDSAKAVKLRELLRAFVAVCLAMEYAHRRGIIHRDLKPGNVMLGEYGETLVVDWGLAKPITQAELFSPAKLTVADDPMSNPLTDSGLNTQDGSSLGTPQYMSAEQAAGRMSEVGPLSDVYSLGATLYQVLTGRAPFTGKTMLELLRQVEHGEFPTPRSVRPEIHPALEAICLKAMALKPADRYPSAKALATDLEHWMADEPVSAFQDGFVERSLRWFRRHRAWAWGVMTTLPVVMLVVFGAIILIEGARRQEHAARKEAVDLWTKAVAAREAEEKQRHVAEENHKRAQREEQRALENLKHATIAEQIAMQEKEKATAEKKKAEAAALESRRTLATLLLSNGQNLQDDGDIPAAALWYSRALPLMSSESPLAEELHRRRLGLMLRQFPRPVNSWILPPQPRRLLFRQVLSTDSRKVAFFGASPDVLVVDSSTGKELWPPLQHAGLVSWVGFSDDNRHLLTVCPPRQVRVWDAATGQAVTPVIESSKNLTWAGFGPVGKAELSHDRQTLLVTTENGPEFGVELFDINTGKSRFPTLTQKDKVVAAHFSGDGQRFIIGAETGVQWHETADGKPVGEPWPEPELWSARFSPDGRWLITTSGQGGASLWDSATGKSVATLVSHRGPCTDAVFSPDSSRVITLHSDEMSMLWEVPSGKAVGLPMEHLHRPIEAVFREDGRQVLTITLENTLRVWDTHDLRLVMPKIRFGSVFTAGFLGDQVQVVGEGRGKAWDLARSADPGTVRVGAADKISHLAFSKNGFLIAAGGNQVWCLQTDGTVVWGPVGLNGSTPEAALQSLGISENGMWLATATDAKTAQLWNVADGKPVAPLPDHQASTTVVAFDRQNQRLATGSEDQTVQISDLATGKLVGKPLQHASPVRAIEFSPDGKMLITGCDDGTFRLWSPETSEPLEDPVAPRTPGQPLTQVRFHPSGLALLVGGNTGDLYLRAPIHEPGGKTAPLQRFIYNGAITQAEFSPDGRLILASGYANLVKLWDWAQEKGPATVLPAGFMAFQARFHPGSQFLATGAIKEVRLWESMTGRMLGPMLWHKSRALAFSADGRWLATVDDQIRLWDLAPEARTPEDVEMLVQLLSGRKLDDRGNLQFLSADKQQTIFETVAKSWPEETRPASVKVVVLPNEK